MQHLSRPTKSLLGGKRGRKPSRATQSDERERQPPQAIEYTLTLPPHLYEAEEQRQGLPPWLLPPAPPRDPTVGRYLHEDSADAAQAAAVVDAEEWAQRAAAALSNGWRGGGPKGEQASEALRVLSRGLEHHPSSDLLWKMYMCCRAAAGWRDAKAPGREGATVRKWATRTCPLSDAVAALAAAEADTAEGAIDDLEGLAARVIEADASRATERLGAHASHRVLDAALNALSVALARGGAVQWLAGLVSAVLDPSHEYDYVSSFDMGAIPSNLRDRAVAAKLAPEPPPLSAHPREHVFHALAWRLTLADTITLWVSAGHVLAAKRIPRAVALSRNFPLNPSTITPLRTGMQGLSGNDSARCGLLATAGGAAVQAATPSASAEERVEGRKVWSAHCNALSGKTKGRPPDGGSQARAPVAAALAPNPSAEAECAEVAALLEELLASGVTDARVIADAAAAASAGPMVREYALWRCDVAESDGNPVSDELREEAAARASNPALDEVMDVLEGRRGWRYRTPLAGPLARALALAAALSGQGGALAVEAAVGALRCNVLAALAYVGALGGDEGDAASADSARAPWIPPGTLDAEPAWAAMLVQRSLAADAATPLPCVQAHIVGAAWLAAVGHPHEVCSRRCRGRCCASPPQLGFRTLFALPVPHELVATCMC